MFVNFTYIMSKLIRVEKDTDGQIKECIKEFLRHHPELNKIPISYNKIIYEISKYYLK